MLVVITINIIIIILQIPEIVDMSIYIYDIYMIFAISTIFLTVPEWLKLYNNINA